MQDRIVIAAADYQFLDTVNGTALLGELQIASTLERLLVLVEPAPRAIVMDLQATSFNALDALELLGAMRVSSRIVLLAGDDLRRLTNAQRAAVTAGLDLAGILERPLMMNALSRLLAQPADGQPLGAADLARALSTDELLLHYQPILERRGSNWILSGAEALVRWQHPQRGLIYPGQFLKLAQSAGLLGALTDFVIEAAVRQAGAWERLGHDLRVAINLAPALVRDVGFAERFLRVLREHDVAPERITLEVIEAASLEDRTLLRETLSRLRLHGVSLSLDDFGTGYSSLTELCRLPFNEIKIDRTLIHDIPEQREATTIAAAIIDLAHRLSMRVCAEGVETAAAREFLAAAGCDLAQGVLFASPMSAADITRFTRQRAAA